MSKGNGYDLISDGRMKLALRTLDGRWFLPAKLLPGNITLCAFADAIEIITAEDQMWLPLEWIKKEKLLKDEDVRLIEARMSGLTFAS